MLPRIKVVQPITRSWLLIDYGSPYWERRAIIEAEPALEPVRDDPSLSLEDRLTCVIRFDGKAADEIELRFYADHDKELETKLESWGLGKPNYNFDSDQNPFFSIVSSQEAYQRYMEKRQKKGQSPKGVSNSSGRENEDEPVEVDNEEEPVEVDNEEEDDEVEVYEDDEEEQNNA